MYFDDRGKDLVLVDEYLNLKITSDRQIYYKLKNETVYKQLTDKKVPLGYSIDDKKRVLVSLNEKILTNYGNQIDAIVNGDTDKTINQDKFMQNPENKTRVRDNFINNGGKQNGLEN